MNEGTNTRRTRAAFLIKLLIVLLFPLVGDFSSSSFGWSSLLLNVGVEHIVEINSISLVLVGLAIMLPCLVFDHYLNSRPITKRIRVRAAMACILSWGISYLLFNYGGIFWTVNRLYSAIVYAPILAITFFVFLPLISRQSIIQRTPFQHQDLSYGLIKSTLHKRVRKESILVGLLWVALVFSPFFVNLVWSFFYWRLIFTGLFNQFLIYSDSIMIPRMSLEFYTNTFENFPIVVLLSSLRFVFVRDVFRYQTNEISKSRLASIAILAEILPSAIFTFTYLVLLPTYPISFIPILLPFPILPIIGFAYIRFSRIPPMKDELWPEYEHRMWFDKTREPTVTESPDESLTVPISYLLISQIRKRLKD